MVGGRVANAQELQSVIAADEQPVDDGELVDENEPVEAPPADEPTIVRVVLIGNTLIEREQRYGYWETFVLAANPHTRYQFRNLGWSGDTVFGDARAGFGTARDGYRKLIAQVRGARPDVVVVGYGNNAAFAGEAGLAEFKTGLNRLLDDLSSAGSPRLVLLSPTPGEDVGQAGVDVAARNRDLALYREAIEEAAEDWDAEFVDLPRSWPSRTGSSLAARTDNGLHLSAAGYWESAPTVAAPFAATPFAATPFTANSFTANSFTANSPWRLELSLNGSELVATSAKGTAVIETGLAQGSTKDAWPGDLTWSLRDTSLPAPAFPGEGVKPDLASVPPRVLQVDGLPPGEYQLLIDRQPIAAGSAKEWADGVTIWRGPDFEQVEELRSAVINKNRWFFHRWRPQNETYLFGFRKHEQGQNAREIPQFDPLVAQLEDVVFELSQPRRRYYTLERRADAK